ncbi:hypothetical protein RHIZ_07750 [Rhizobium skierniewicense]|uniref:hypothetical protein n=1 Tax=Rhizobium skierniewicense TaxID=984260 RepID=UPI001FADDBB6|nr:hypothetical protein [Rhizobium skierniewicense]MCI9865832.1 hypothetical protein [Rhizobium skierniewicense]
MKHESSTLELTPVSDAARAQLREVRFAGGKLSISATFEARAKALELRKAGYVNIGESGYDLRLTGLGQAYLDRLMRAH